MITIPESLLYSLLGFAIVFFGLILLMIVIAIQAKLAAPSKKKEETKQVSGGAEPVEKEKVLAPGSAGEIKLYNVSPRTAAMLMAITADKMGVPLNQLRFISIKCLDD